MAQFPRDPAPDATLALLSDGYEFISKRCERHRSDVFLTRLMLRNAICMRGKEAAEIFYGGDRFTRRGALPMTTLKLLTDRGSVQLLDGADHRQRKQMFMSLMTPDGIGALVDRTMTVWRARLPRWESEGRIVLLRELHDVFCQSACAWAGVPLADAEVGERAREFATMIDGSGAVGPWNWWAILLRRRTERWIGDIVARTRSGKLNPDAGSALDVITAHRDLDGEPLTRAEAVVEIINVLRPTVAIARFVTFAALALHEQPAWRERLRNGDDADLTRFVQEVRRFYPFFPLVGGRVLQGFTWQGHRFEPGAWVIFDLYGTNRHPRLWPEPNVFDPERFRNWDGSAFDFVPQGAAEYALGHRCPGEWITIEVMKAAIRFLTSAITYDVPAQDLRIDLSKMPAVPRSRFIIENVRSIR